MHDGLDDIGNIRQAVLEDHAARVRENQQELAAQLEKRFDYIVCGAGTSGCVVASRLGAILPRVTTGNTMAPCVVIGEQAAAFLKRDQSDEGVERVPSRSRSWESS